ncbi:3-dehydroquinate synthase [Pontibacillus halophilus JSM 076056 = DSM 19796]|uniref:3-dehydroquinate synthase n=1 Tax=Pontibacillus halophilus JSM 076056 = DSM 19796 TaxID=1385510 RepID=A0A0A5GLX9_9BACI|nr:3-dehydroquinate synthase [Pontibacillus halophilus]KGX92160.1 3-dehydroquinate synthase [Pontibacillus halophilus JSM 076056 = DSM 19796]
MNTLRVDTNETSYEVQFQSGIRKRIKEFLPRAYSNILIVTDDVVAKLYLDDVQSGLEGEGVQVASCVVPSGESSKSMEQFYRCHTAALEENLDRKSLLVALGGGMIGDLAGFVASTYMRGIDYVQVPTTILAHDSSVGGKVAINHEQGKNMIGAFHQPVAVLYDTDTLWSLPEQEWRSGMAEVIKHGLLADGQLYEQLVTHQTPFQSFDGHLLTHLLYRGVAVKSKIVKEDERENGVRSYLNLGHTLGHAIEGEAGYGEITHGEAVALGIYFALHLSERVYGSKLPLDSYTNWLHTYNYPLHKLKEYSIDVLLPWMRRDKKNEHGSIRMVLLKEVGEPALVPVEEDLIREVFLQVTEQG